MRSVIFAIGVSLALVLSGCIGAADQESSPSGSDQPIAPGDVDPNSDMGVVQGTVVSEEATPIEAAEVALQGTEFQTKTDATGLFQLREVPPGEYALLVGKLGYQSMGRKIEVQAGHLSQVSFTLSAIQSSEVVYYTIFHFVGWFDCALGTQVWISSCSYPYTAAYLTAKENGVNLSNYGAPPDIQKNVHRFNITVSPGIGTLVAELTWTSASAAATRMLLMVLCGDYDPILDECKDRIRYGPPNGVEGPNPVRSVIDGSEFTTKGKGKYELKDHPVWIMNYVGLPFGGPQLAFQQKFDVWDSVFYNGPAPEDWTVLQDQ